MNQLRPIKVIKNYIPNAEGSCIFQMGNTKVLCVVSIEDRVPPFAEEKGTGWLTAEYSMLPRAGDKRTPRNALAGGRAKEIQRLIGRSLRAVVDLKKLGRHTLIVDCDVLQADGGTRTASVNGAFLALVLAADKLIREKKIIDWPIKDYLAAVSVGIVEGEKILDLAAKKDNIAEMDMNVVMTGKGEFIEVQGTAEGKPFSQKELNELLDLARLGIKQIIQVQKKNIGKLWR